jgi:hypothetical protein
VVRRIFVNVFASLLEAAVDGWLTIYRCVLLLLGVVSGGAAGTGAKDAQTILDDLSNSATVSAPSAAEALSNAQGTSS